LLERAKTMPSTNSGHQIFQECQSCGEERKQMLEYQRLVQEMTRRLKEEEERNYMLHSEMKKA
jgi:hypothetical protein